MKVKELLNLLKDEDPERLIILPIDPEGNGYNQLDEISRMAYNPETEEIGIEELTDELRAEKYTERDVIKDGQKALVFYPR